MNWIDVYKFHRLHEVSMAHSQVENSDFVASNPDDPTSGFINFRICSFCGFENGCPDCRRFLEGLSSIGFNHMVPVYPDDPPPQIV